MLLLLNLFYTDFQALSISIQNIFLYSSIISNFTLQNQISRRKNEIHKTTGWFYLFCVESNLKQKQHFLCSFHLQYNRKTYSESNCTHTHIARNLNHIFIWEKSKPFHLEHIYESQKWNCHEFHNSV